MPKAVSKLWEICTQPTKRNQLGWFIASWAIAAFYSLLGMGQALAGPYVVQDDARQHIFWMQRFVDPDLFPNDLIADYFQSVAPFGYTWVYKIAATLGIQPDLFSKILPFFLVLVTIAYCYWTVLAVFPVPFAGFISSTIFSQSLWYSSEHASGTPRAFLYPLLLAFIYYLIREQPRAYLLVLALQALFYPQLSLICLGVLALRMVRWRSRRLSRSPADYVPFAVGFCLVGIILALTKAQADFGPIVTRAEAIQALEFQDSGRNAFFDDSLDFWFNGRGGLLHERGFTPATIVAGAMLPLLLWLPIKDELRARLSDRMIVFVQLLVASLGLFFLAHLVLFRLHLPNRYTSHTLRTVLALCCGISWTLIAHDLARIVASVSRRPGIPKPSAILEKSEPVRHLLFVALSGLFTLFILLYPALFFETFPKVGYYDFSAHQKLYDYFAAQPKDSVIASLSEQTSNIPTFSRRTVLVSQEHAIAYQKGYYDQFRQRVIDLIQAQYSTDAAPVLKATQTYGIDYWLLDNSAYQPDYMLRNDWLLQYQPTANEAMATVGQGATPVLQQVSLGCVAASSDAWTILDADCVYTAAEKLSSAPAKPSTATP